jgi:hypothetical protein
MHPLVLALDGNSRAARVGSFEIGWVDFVLTVALGFLATAPRCRARTK